MVATTALHFTNKVVLLYQHCLFVNAQATRLVHRNSRVYPLRRQESGPPTRSYCCCCCWCCSPVLLLLWFGHTHAHKKNKKPVPLTSGSRVYIRRGIQQAAQVLISTVWQRQSADSKKYTYSHNLRVEIHRHTSKVLRRPLRRRLPERPISKSGLSCVSRPPPLGMFVSCLGTRRDHSSRHRQSPTCPNKIPTQSRVSLVELGQISGHFIELFEKIPTKTFLSHTWCAYCSGQRAK